MINRLERYALKFCILALLYMSVGILLPFSFFVGIEKVAYSDMCVGDTKQFVTTDRSVWADIRGDVSGQLVFFDGQTKYETTIMRGNPLPVKFTYEKEAPEGYWIEWNSPVQTVGLYGAQDTVKIYPLPFWEIDEFFPAEGHQFNVSECY